MREDSERSKRLKVDGPKRSKWTVQNSESGRSRIKMNGQKRYGWRNLESSYVHRIRVHLGVGYNYGERALRIRIHLGLG